MTIKMILSKTLLVCFTLSISLWLHAENKQIQEASLAVQSNAERVIRVYQTSYPYTPEKIFPLLCPVLEYEWLQDWHADILYTDSGVAELDCVFRTDFDPAKPEVWTVTRYEKNSRIEFVVVNMDWIKRFSITLEPCSEETTHAEWTQVITALNPRGERYLKEFSDELYQQIYEEVSMRLCFYLKHESMYRSEDSQ